MGGDHSQHAAHAGHGATRARISGFDELAAQVLPLGLAEPVLISPPSPKKPSWVVRSDSQNRPLRTSLEFAPKTFEQVKEERFADRALIDRVVGVGVAAHEGQLFGWFNQLLGLLTAIGYLVLVVTSALMWWRRRPTGALGAPLPLAKAPRLAPFVIALIVALGVFLPMLGVTLILTLIVEGTLRRLSPDAARWLGLSPFARRPAEGVGAAE